MKIIIPKEDGDTAATSSTQAIPENPAKVIVENMETWEHLTAPPVQSTDAEVKKIKLSQGNK